MKPAIIDRQQRRYHTWPIAMVRLTAQRIVAAGFELARDIDDLDAFTFTDVADASTGPIYLILHDQARSRSFNVYAATEFSRKDALTRLERAFRCKKVDYEWITPFPSFPGSNPASAEPSLQARTDDGALLDAIPWERRMEGPNIPLAEPVTR